MADDIFATIQVKRDTDEALNLEVNPLQEGEPCYNTTTGKFVIGDGETLIPGLPDLRKQFQNVVTVAKSGKKGSADFICSNYASDDLCIEDVLNKSNSGDIICILKGTYNLYSRITQTGKSLNIKAIGKVIFNFLTDGDPSNNDYPHIYLAGSSVITTTVSADVADGAYQISLASSTGVQEGDLLSINKNVLWAPSDYPTMQTGEMYEIKSVSGSTVTLSQPTIRDYPISSTVNVEIYRPIEVTIDGLELIFPANGTPGSGTTRAKYTAIFVNYCKNSIIQNCTVHRASVSGINFEHGYNVRVTNCNVYDGNYDGSGYGVGIWTGTAFSKVDHNHIENCRHCVTANASEFKIQSRNMLVCDNTLISVIDNSCGGPHAIDSHCVIVDITATDNTIYPNETRWGPAFAGGAKLNIFTNNTIIGGGYAYVKRGVMGNTTHIIEGNNCYGLSGPFARITGSSSTYTINNNYADGGTYILDCVDLTSPFGNISIKNNKFKGFTYKGIWLYSIANNSRIEIANNELTNISNDAILLTGTDGYSYYCTIENNKIINPNNSYGGTAAGIALTNITNAKITENTIIDINGRAGKGIVTGNGCDYNIIKNNITLGMTGSKIYLTGTHNIVKDNPNYPTENTGTATITASSTSVVVSHGLVAAPTKIIVTPFGNVGNCWVDSASITATEMTIRCSTAPETDTTVSWSASV